MTIGDFVLVVGFVSAFYPRLFDLVFSFRDIAKNYADIEKYFGVLDYDIQIKDPQKPVDVPGISGEIEFKNVSFSYGERKEDTVSGVDLKVRQGQSVALVGRSGSGKTTLIRLLVRFYDVDKGKITIDDIDIRDFTKANLRSFIGVVPQEPILFNNTIGYNIGYGKEEATKKEIKAAAKMANIDKFIESLPKKYNTQVGERGIKVSGGQKQRLAIARMILSDPEIIIFDEATSQLDSESERLIQEAFWKVVKNKTTIIIAHRLSTAMRADKIVVLEKGKIIESGSHKALLEEKDSLYGYFWDLQINID
jgi:ATP-binding cassette subfamily B protein